MGFYSFVNRTVVGQVLQDGRGFRGDGRVILNILAIFAK